MIALVQQMAQPRSRTLPDSFALARAGDAAAFEQLIVEQERLVLRTAWRLLGRKEDAQDAAQEVFLRLYKGIGKLREDTVIEAWLYRVTVNVAEDLKRKRGTVAAQFVDRGHVETHDEDLEFARQKALVQKLIAELPNQERAALVLREFEELSTREVAEILGSSEVTVRSQISSARAKLKDWVAQGRTGK